MTAWALLHTFLFTKKIKNTKAYYFIGGYGLLVVLSTIFSKPSTLSLLNLKSKSICNPLTYNI